MANMQIRIFPDGKVQGTIRGIKGKRCTDYISLIEEMTNCRILTSDYTPEFYEAAEVRTTVRSDTAQTVDDEETVGLRHGD